MKSTVAPLLIALFLISNIPIAASDAPIPRPPWKLELIASAPDIRHPSVVCAAPDGRIFVAEDPMDISAPANASHGRIITFHPDGRRTIFATNLYAVFGLQYLEGKVYVLHNPRFTVFKDSGDIGTDPEDLIESTNPNPWALDWNDHVPANFKLAMDGYFYIAVGDKGIYNAKTKDGRTINLHGGGILRIKPDGTGAEIFSTGVRNILDVAITSEDEIFTYDNTDEHDWMGRLTHMVDGGFYGYPHHFIPRRPYTLWMMHDFGGGAATGTFANTEDALPPEYHDNLFLADFGKRQIIRVVLERDGATFKVARHEELFSEMPDSFRPVGIAPSHDGKSILICDWQHRDTKENVAVGRLWKLTWSGETFSQPKPSWYIPAAQGQPFEATTEQLSSALAHPSRNVRLTAQRELSDRRVMPKLPANPPPYAQWHNVWALHNAPQKSLVVTSLADDSSLRRQQLRQIGHSSPSVAWRLVPAALKDADASVRFHAATALSRASHDPLKFIEPLLNALPEPDLFARHAIERALNRLGLSNPDSWKPIVSALTNNNPDVRAPITYALRETYDPSLASELRHFIQSTSAPQPAREAAVQSLASVTRKLPEWRGEWWAYHPALAPAPIRTEAWSATEPNLQLFASILAKNPELRLTTIRAITEVHETSLAHNLRELYETDSREAVRIEILQALTAFKDTNSSSITLAAFSSAQPNLISPALNLARYSHSTEVLTNLASLISKTNLSPDLCLEAINTSAHLRNAHALEAIIAATESSEPALRESAIAALGKIGGPAAVRTLFHLIDQLDPGLNLQAANALSEIPLDPSFQQQRTERAVGRLLILYNSHRTQDAALEALLRLPDATAVPAYIDALGNANPTTRDRARKILEEFRDQALPVIQSRIPTMRPVELAEVQKLYPNRPDLTLIARERTIPTVADYVNFALKNKGDSTRGRRIFFNESGVACIKCHTVAGEGHAVGPDMTTIGAQFPRDALIEHIVNPSKSVREGYQQVLIETSDDESFAGLIKSESADTLTILTAQAKLQTIPKSKITSRHSSQLSLMPDGLHLGLTLEEFTDLIAYLESLKNDPRKPSK